MATTSPRAVKLWLEFQGKLRRKQTTYIAESFSRPPIYDSILAFLDPGDIIRFSKTCAIISHAVSDFFPRAYKIEPHLSRYFSDPDGFRRLQANTATLISGSNALQFMDRTYYPESDLDLYVPKYNAFQVGEWLMESEGYRFVPSGTMPPTTTFKDVAFQEDPGENGDGFIEGGTEYRRTGIANVFYFEKEGRSIQIIATKISPFHCILSFHSTCVMNFISYDAAYSLYPKATFDARIGLSIAEISPKESRALAKYAGRGWVMTPHANWPHDEEEMKKLFSLEISRWVLDRYTWRVPLSPLEIPPRKLSAWSPALTTDPTICNNWKLIPSVDTGTIIAVFNKLTSTILKHTYLWADEDLRDQVLPFLKEYGTFEHAKVRGLLHWTSPEARAIWTWWDTHIYKFYDRYFEERGTKQYLIG